MSFCFQSLLHQSFEEHSARPAIIYRDETISYGDLQRRVSAAANWLRKAGVKPGDRVLLYTPDKLPFLLAHLGAIRLGAVSLPVNAAFTRDELRYFAADSEASVIVAGEGQVEAAAAVAGQLTSAPTVLLSNALLEATEPLPREPDISPEDPALILYSSGTTGQPKGIVHTHDNLAHSVRAIAERWRFSEDDVLVNCLPLFHIHGLSFATHVSLLSGSAMRMEDRFHPTRIWDAIARSTVFMAIPTFYYSFLARSEFRETAKAWGGVRLFTCGSAPLRPEVLPELEEILGGPVINRYGMTESHIVTSLPLDGPWPQGSVGLPLPGLEMRLVNEEKRAIPPGEVGLVTLRGPNLFRQYWRKPEATREALADGWFDTGDLGKQDENGFLTLVGRQKDLIITNGFNVYPPVVERVLNDCPGVAESAVIGLPDDRRGERVAAIVVREDPTLEVAAIRAHCRERLVDYQRPSVIEFADELPRNAMGKVLKRELRSAFGEEEQAS